MRVLTIISENQPGLLAKITQLLKDNDITLSDFSGEVLGNTAMFKLAAKPYKKAFRVLSDAGYRALAHDNLIIRLEEKPGALAELSFQLFEGEVDVRGMHIVDKSEGQCLVALETTDDERARELLGGRLM